MGPGYVGQGVDVAELRRLADGLVFARQVDSSGELGRLSQLSTLSDRIDTLVSDPATGISCPWASFFTAALTSRTQSPPTVTASVQKLISTPLSCGGAWLYANSSPVADTALHCRRRFDGR